MAWWDEWVKRAQQGAQTVKSWATQTRSAANPVRTNPAQPRYAQPSYRWRTYNPKPAPKVNRDWRTHKPVYGPTKQTPKVNRDWRTHQPVYGPTQQAPKVNRDWRTHQPLYGPPSLEQQRAVRTLSNFLGINQQQPTQRQVQPYRTYPGAVEYYAGQRARSAWAERLEKQAKSYWSTPTTPMAQNYDWEDYAKLGDPGYGNMGGGGGGYGYPWPDGGGYYYGGGGGGYEDAKSWYANMVQWNYR